MPSARKKRSSRPVASKRDYTGIVKIASGDSVMYVPRSALREWKVTEDDLKAVQAFRALKGQERTRAAHQIIRDTIVNVSSRVDTRFAVAVDESESLLQGYATLDEAHRTEISRLIRNIRDYLRDETRKRPYNTLMLAAPGAGKSHFIKQLASAMRAERVQAVTFNMATMQSPDDMEQPIDELRNLKVNDRFPLLFLDEFDSDPTRYPSLLPLLWDGELQIGHRDLKLGKAVIVLAGSNPDLPKTMEQSATMRLDMAAAESAPAGKLVDLLSRINGGVINIPDLDLRTEHRDRRVDKVCITVSLLRVRFGDRIRLIPRSLLRFVANTVFRYGVRSIAHLIDVISTSALIDGKLDAEALGLPITSEADLQDSSLKLHLLDKDQGFGIVNRWSELRSDREYLDLEPPYAMRPTLY